MHKFGYSLISVAVASLVLGGCSSGGGDETPPASTTKTVSISGKAIDGYLQSATVCLDLSLDGYCQIGTEPATSTDANGGYTLELSSEHQAHTNFKRAPILVYDGIDSDTGKRFEGKLQAPNDGTAINVTPLTTMVAKSIANDKSVLTSDEITAKINAVETQLKKALGLDNSIDLGADPVALKDIDESLIKASLSLQKSLQTLAKAGINDSNNTRSEAELLDDMFEAMLFSLDDLDDSDVGLDILLDTMLTNDAALALMPYNSQQSVGSAKQIGQKVNSAFDQLFGDDELKNLSVLIEQDLARLEKEFESFDFNTTFPSAFLSDIDASTFDNFDFRKEGFKAEIEFYGLTLSDEDYAKIPDNIQPYNMYDIENIELLKDIFPDLYKKIIAEITSWETIEQDAQSKYSQEVTQVALPFTLYSIDNYYDYFDGKSYAQTKATFNNDNTLKYTVVNMNDEELISPPSYNLSSNGIWIEEPSSINYTLNQDGTFNLPYWNEKMTLTNEYDLSNDTYYVQEINDVVAMPTGALKYTLKFEKDIDDINMYSQTPKQETSFSQFIESQCGMSFFQLDNDNNQEGLAFEGTNSSTGYTCDGSQTQGNIVTGADLRVAGTWKIVQKRNTDILLITPTHLDQYTENGKLLAVAMVNGFLYTGTFQAKGSTEITSHYNNIAIEAIKERINNP